MAVLPELDKACSTLIFKASREKLHHGALGTARTLGRLGVPVYAIVEDSWTPLAASRYLTKAFVWKNWPSDPEECVSAILKVGQLIRQPAILVPLDDQSAVLVAENSDVLRQWFRFPRLPKKLPRQLANKTALYSLCAGLGIPCPKTVVPHSIDDIREFIRRASFPVVAKAADQWQLLKDRYSSLMIPTPEALLKFYGELIRQEHPRIILQQYIPGDDWIYHGYCNSETNLYVSFTGKKLLSYPPDAGSTALGVSVRNDALGNEAEKLLRATSYSGIVDMDWRRDTRDGQYKLLDCNPRVGMNFRLFENQAGIDVIRALHLDLTGRRVDCREMVQDRYLTVEPFYVLASLRGWRLVKFQREIRIPAGRAERAWLNGDDQLPFYVMILRLLLRTIRRAVHRIMDKTFRWT